MKLIPPIRGLDKHGEGHFGASRGARIHKGVDLSCYPGSIVCSTVQGRVTKLGMPYADHPEYKYVQVTDSEDLKHRFFYIEPIVVLGSFVYVDTQIGKSQDLGLIYPGITNHVHYEIKKGNEYIDPTSRVENVN